MLFFYFANNVRGKNMNKILKRVLIGAGIFVGVVVLGAGGYVGYVILSYNRIGNCDLKVDSK